jgi:hypothetical protein
MKPLKEIKYVLSDHRDKLFSEYPIQSLAIFGSYARNEQDENSDLDIMVEFNGKIGIRFVDLAEDLENIIGVKVDLVSRKGIKEKYYQSILPDLVYV